MDIFAKMKTVTGALLISFSLVGCGTSGYYPDMSVANHYNRADTVYDVFFNWGKHTAYSVPSQYRQEHENCVFFALDALQVGETCKWRQQKGSGSVRVSAISPSGCHNLTSTIWYKERTKSWQDRACPRGENWRFIR
jgi:hypothetical protein